MKRAIFLDRDGTVIDDTGYLNDPDELVLMPRAAEAMVQLKAAGYLLVVITNQSGIARGIVTPEQLQATNGRMRDALRAGGADYDALYFCPHHPTEAAIAEYAVDCDCRKPRPGMLLRAAVEHDIDLARSWLIGDAERDVEAGIAAGCRTVRVAESGSETKADHLADGIYDAAQFILGEGPR